MSHNEPCSCKNESDCPHAAYPACVYRLRGDLDNLECSPCQASTWHLDGACLRCKDVAWCDCGPGVCKALPGTRCLLSGFAVRSEPPAQDTK